jgi:dipeptidyl aminopeptidase/acylaminoacyl peptidase
MRPFIAFLAVVFPSVLIAQDKRPIAFSDYDAWNSIGEIVQSGSGDLVSYTINPSVGDGTLFIENVVTGKKRAFARGKTLAFHHKEEFCVFLISPQYDSVRQKKLDKVAEEKLPKDSLAIYWPAKDSVAYFPNIKSYQLAERGDVVAFLSTEDLRGCKTENPPKKKKRKGGYPGGKTSKRKKKKKGDCNCEVETGGKTLKIYAPAAGVITEHHCVDDYEVGPTDSLLIVTSEKGEKDTLDVWHGSLRLSSVKLELSIQAENFLAVSELTFDYSGSKFAFIASRDTSEKKNFELHCGGLLIVDSTRSGMPEGYSVSEFGSLKFSKDGTKLYFGTNKIVRQEPKDTLLDSEKAKVDVWVGTDPLIQPNQLVDLPTDKKKNYLAVYHLEEDRMVQLEDEKVDNIRTLRFGNSNVALGVDEKPYHVERTWMSPWRSDVYAVNVTDGSKTLLQEGAWETGSISPSGKFYVWFNPEDSIWYGKTVGGKEKWKLTKSIDACFASDMNGQPSLANSEGFAGWTNDLGGEWAIVYSEWDIFMLKPEDPDKVNYPVWYQLNDRPVNAKHKFRLMNITDEDSAYVAIPGNYLVGVDDRTKRETLYEIVNSDVRYQIKEKLGSNHTFIYFTKARKSNRLLLRRMSFKDYPELESTDVSFSSLKTLTKTNPLQAELNWGTVEFVDWKSYSGIPLRGLLYKPENFDATKKYPMIVYYYEMYQDQFHTYYAPKATASIIYPTEYVSNGYIVFIPDVRYKPGYPAKSAYDCIVSGSDYLVRKYSWIDSTRLGLQGQSWGGYQTAMLVTMTDKYKAAMAGAPVSNMISAYGGIRWGTGLCRMFQYEHGQSRIGNTIWERPDLYIENSPLFHLPNVKTPLLVMHNDDDGAVPWYQGIELYMGLRRLGKPVWMLNYNGDKHNLTQLANKKDLSIRMRQFFDHYLLGQPAPEWMTEGIPALEKGKNNGFEPEK